MSGTTDAVPTFGMPHHLPRNTLLADIGGTNARFLGIDDDGRPGASQILPTRSADTPTEAISRFLESSGMASPERAAIAVACPVDGDVVTFTNLAWRFSIRALKQELGLSELTVVNDAVATAHALPFLGRGDLEVWRPKASPELRPLAMIAPGTGLGVAGLVPIGDAGSPRWHAIAGEAGHATMAARTAAEDVTIAALRDRFGHVSAERVVSGPGLANIHSAVMMNGGTVDGPPSPEELAARLRAGDRQAVETFGMFADFLGTVASDVVLTFGATGGLYLAGGVLPSLGPHFDRTRFFERFADKGRFGELLSRVPVALVRHPIPAFVGLAALLCTEPNPR
jgi:glucokinase